jgi:hypothetical protein
MVTNINRKIDGNHSEIMSILLEKRGELKEKGRTAGTSPAQVAHRRALFIDAYMAMVAMRPKRP